VSLTVADQERSPRFYETFFGFDCSGDPDGEGCLHLTDAGGFDVTLAVRADVAPPPSLHFGIRLAEPDAVRRLRERLASANVRTGDVYESESRVAFHCWDADGYQVEVYWAGAPH
jgi:hypothetical protein